MKDKLTINYVFYSKLLVDFLVEWLPETDNLKCESG